MQDNSSIHTPTEGSVWQRLRWAFQERKSREEGIDSEYLHTHTVISWNQWQTCSLSENFALMEKKKKRKKRRKKRHTKASKETRKNNSNNNNKIKRVWNGETRPHAAMGAVRCVRYYSHSGGWEFPLIATQTSVLSPCEKVVAIYILDGNTKQFRRSSEVCPSQLKMQWEF